MVVTTRPSHIGNPKGVNEKHMTRGSFKNNVVHHHAVQARDVSVVLGHLSCALHVNPQTVDGCLPQLAKNLKEGCVDLSVPFGHLVEDVSSMKHVPGATRGHGSAAYQPLGVLACFLQALLEPWFREEGCASIPRLGSVL